jgi:hypothetical protein
MRCHRSCRRRRRGRRFKIILIILSRRNRRSRRRRRRSGRLHCSGRRSIFFLGLLFGERLALRPGKSAFLRRTWGCGSRLLVFLLSKRKSVAQFARLGKRNWRISSALVATGGEHTEVNVQEKVTDHRLWPGIDFISLGGRRSRCCDGGPWCQ